MSSAAKVQKEEEKAKRDAEKLAEEAARKAEEERKAEDARKRKEEQRLKKEAEKRALEAERLRKEEERRKRQQEERERELERERKRKEKEEADRKKKEEEQRRQQKEAEIARVKAELDGADKALMHSKSPARTHATPHQPALPKANASQSRQDAARTVSGKQSQAAQPPTASSSPRLGSATLHTVAPPTPATQTKALSLPQPPQQQQRLRSVSPSRSFLTSEDPINSTPSLASAASTINSVPAPPPGITARPPGNGMPPMYRAAPSLPVIVNPEPYRSPLSQSDLPINLPSRSHPGVTPAPPPIISDPSIISAQVGPQYPLSVNHIRISPKGPLHSSRNTLSPQPISAIGQAQTKQSFHGLDHMPTPVSIGSIGSGRSVSGSSNGPLAPLGAGRSTSRLLPVTRSEYSKPYGSSPVGLDADHVMGSRALFDDSFGGDDEIISETAGSASLSAEHGLPISKRGPIEPFSDAIGESSLLYIRRALNYQEFVHTLQTLGNGDHWLGLRLLSLHGLARVIRIL